MSRGPGRIERRIHELFAAAAWDKLDRSYTVAELCSAVFGTDTPNRAQRGSILHAAHALLRRAREASDRCDALFREADQAAREEFGEPTDSVPGNAYHAFLDAHPSMQHRPHVDLEILVWRATELPDRQVVFHHGSRPARIWAVGMAPAGIVWADAEIVSITDSRVNVRYRDQCASLKRMKLYLGLGGAWWRGVRFVAERDGWVARFLDELWREQYAAVLGPDGMTLAEAAGLLRVPERFTRDDITYGFRRAAKRCHPDQGGTAKQFRRLVKARDLLLTSIGASAAPPKMPSFAPKGVKVVYRKYTGTRASHITGDGVGLRRIA